MCAGAVSFGGALRYYAETHEVGTNSARRPSPVAHFAQIHGKWLPRPYTTVIEIKNYEGLTYNERVQFMNVFFESGRYLHGNVIIRH